jgi:antitoxin (DNA-binding transcriptional repressor) of toxin-antitoxin stability system
MAQVEAGESFVVTRNGEPVAELRPLARRRRLLVSKAEIAALAAHGPHIDAGAFRRDMDTFLDQGLRHG